MMKMGFNLRMHSFCVNFFHVVSSDVMVNVIDALRLSGSGVIDALMLSSSGVKLVVYMVPLNWQELVHPICRYISCDELFVSLIK